MEGTNESYHGNSSGLVLAQCSPRPRPVLGFQRIIHGDGTSVGSVIALHCPDRHKLIGDSVRCVLDSNSTYWAGETFCKPLSYNEAYGFQLAVMVSTVSLAIICIMSVAFITCCLLNCIEKSSSKDMDRDPELPPQWEEQRDHRRERNSNKSRNNNNNNFMEKEITQWNQRDAGHCENYHTCRCQQPDYGLMAPPCSYTAAARLPVLPGYEYNQPLNPQNPQSPTSSYSYCQPHVGSSRQTLNPDLVQVSRRSDPVWECGPEQSCLSGASNQSRSKTSAKDFSIRVISV